MDDSTAGRLETPETKGQPPASVMRIMGQLMLMPFTVFACALELLFRTVREAGHAAERGMDVMVGPRLNAPVAAHAEVRAPPAMDAPAVHPPPACHCAVEPPRRTEEINVFETTKDKEKPRMQDQVGEMRRDRDLHDDMLKLVRFKILFVRREYEHAFPEREDLVHDSMDGTAFAAWKVAEFIQELQKGHTPIPDKWRKKGFPSAQHRSPDGCMLKGLDDEDKKYLRVYYEVLERYPREKFKYEEEQIDILRKMLDKMPPSGVGSSEPVCNPGEAGSVTGTGSSMGVSGSSGQGATDRGLGYTPK